MLARYAQREMVELWSEESEWGHVLKVEQAALRARLDLNDTSTEACSAILSFTPSLLNIPRLKEIEADVQHDVIAFVMMVQETLRGLGFGGYAHELHKRLTSFDVRDPALVLQLRKSNDLIVAELEPLRTALLAKAEEHRATIMIGRSHGQFAEPDSFGRLLLGFADDIRRGIERLERVKKFDLSEAKISGAIGNYAGMNPQLETIALDYLGLKPAKVETQILQRDRHAAYLSAIAIVGGSIERMFRTLQLMAHSLVCEVEEPRGRKQRGSSHMPQKKNPIGFEQMFGMARLLRGAANAAIENIATLECRDISGSSVERHIFPDATSQLHYMARRSTKLIIGMLVFPDRMRENLRASYGVWAAGPLREALMDAGVSYDVAYDFTQQASFDSKDRRRDLMLVTILGEDRRVPGFENRSVRDLIGEEKWDLLTSPWGYVRPGVEEAFRRQAT